MRNHNTLPNPGLQFFWRRDCRLGTTKPAYKRRDSLVKRVMLRWLAFPPICVHTPQVQGSYAQHWNTRLVCYEIRYEMSGFQSKKPRDREQQPLLGITRFCFRALNVFTHAPSWTTMADPKRLASARTIGKPVQPLSIYWVIKPGIKEWW
jgi:hypothetical protein